MARAIGGWLSGPPVAPGSPPGVRLGFPEDGPGSVASTAPRVGAFVIDGIVANLLVGIPYLFGVRYGPDTRGLAIFGAFLLVEFIFDAIYGQTVGKRLAGIRVIRADGDGLASVPWLLLRTALLGMLIPPLIWDRDRRGLHDKAAGTIVVVDPNKIPNKAANKAANNDPNKAKAAAKPAPRTAAKQPAAVASAPVAANAPAARPQKKRPPAKAARRKKHR
jgi:uncharacterized RDD family membrane protein YckC